VKKIGFPVIGGILALFLLFQVAHCAAAAPGGDISSRLALLKTLILEGPAAQPSPIRDGLRLFFHTLLALGLILTLLMTIDCALNRREIFWFFVLWLLGPLGGLVYLLYHREQVTFPAPLIPPGLFDNLGATASRRCSRCHRSGVRLVPHEEGRTVHHICELCRDEAEVRKDIDDAL